jgi:hypothetical protein
VYVIPEAATDSAGRIRTIGGDDTLLVELINQIGNAFCLALLGLLLKADVVRFSNEPHHTFVNGLAHHDRASEMTVTVKLNAFGGGCGKMVVCNYAFGGHLQESVDSLLYGCIQFVPDALFYSETSHLM